MMDRRVGEKLEMERIRGMCIAFDAHFGDQLPPEERKAIGRIRHELDSGWLKYLAQIRAALKVRPRLRDKVLTVPELRPLASIALTSHEPSCC